MCNAIFRSELRVGALIQINRKRALPDYLHCESIPPGSAIADGDLKGVENVQTHFGSGRWKRYFQLGASRSYKTGKKISIRCFGFFTLSI